MNKDELLEMFVDVCQNWADTRKGSIASKVETDLALRSAFVADIAIKGALDIYYAEVGKT